jgi:hypothetical protein
LPWTVIAVATPPSDPGLSGFLQLLVANIPRPFQLQDTDELKEVASGTTQIDFVYATFVQMPNKPFALCR